MSRDLIELRRIAEYAAGITNRSGGAHIDETFTPEAVLVLLERIVTAERERDTARTRAAHLQLQAEVWAMEARGHKATVHEAYQAVTGATGEPGNWNGARPIADALSASGARNRSLEAGVGEAEIQITYLHERFGETGSGNAVLAILRALLGHGEPAIQGTTEPLGEVPGGDNQPPQAHHE